MAIRHTLDIVLPCFVQSFMSQSAASVISRRSFILTTPFSFANLTVQPTSQRVWKIVDWDVKQQQHTN